MGKGGHGVLGHTHTQAQLDHYEREEPKISHFKIKNTPKASVKYPNLFDQDLF